MRIAGLSGTLRGTRLSLVRSGQCSARCFATQTVFSHVLENGVVKVSEATSEQVATHGKTGALFAVVLVKGKQYRVVEGDAIMTDKIEEVTIGDKMKLDEVLMVGGSDVTVVGQPRVAGAVVHVTVEEQAQTEKVIVFKKKRRKGYKVSQANSARRH